MCLTSSEMMESRRHWECLPVVNRPYACVLAYGGNMLMPVKIVAASPQGAAEKFVENSYGQKVPACSVEVLVLDPDECRWERYSVSGRITAIYEAYKVER